MTEKYIMYDQRYGHCQLTCPKMHKLGIQLYQIFLGEVLKRDPLSGHQQKKHDFLNTQFSDQSVKIFCYSSQVNPKNIAENREHLKMLLGIQNISLIYLQQRNTAASIFTWSQTATQAESTS